MTLSISDSANPNYLARPVELKRFKDHPNADAIKFAIVDGCEIIVPKDTEEGTVMVYFPVESAINKELLSSNNCFSKSILNQDQTQKGFFGKNGRVKAVRLRGELSLGYLAPLSFFDRMSPKLGKELRDNVGKEFDSWDDRLIVKKYEKPVKSNLNTQQSGKPKVSRMIEGQARLHEDTLNLRKFDYIIKPDTEVVITEKYHGTSFWVGNVLTKRKLNILQRLFKRPETEYSMVYGSRKVIKNESETKDSRHYYGEDIWGEVAKNLWLDIPKGYTIYGEIIGFLKEGGAIQKGYDYGCESNTHQIRIYRVTVTNVDGDVMDLSYNQMKQFCDERDIPVVELLAKGTALNISLQPNSIDHFGEEWISEIEDRFAKGMCLDCKNNVPREGCVVSLTENGKFQSFKLKSKEFLEYETKQLDSEENDQPTDVDSEV